MPKKNWAAEAAQLQLGDGLSDLPADTYHLAVVDRVYVPADAHRRNVSGVLRTARPGSVIIEMSGTTDQIDNFIEAIRPFGLKEMTRSGRIAMLRGAQIAELPGDLTLYRSANGRGAYQITKRWNVGRRIWYASVIVRSVRIVVAVLR